MVDAQIFIDGKFTDKTIKKITNQDLIDKLITTPGGLTGPLKLEDFTELEEIEINDTMKGAPSNLDNDLTELTIINCPKLKKISVAQNELTKIDITKVATDNGKADGNPAPANHLTEIAVGQNVVLEEISLEYCPNIKRFLAKGCSNLKKVPGVDKRKFGLFSVDEGLFNYIFPEKLSYFREVVKYVRGTLGI